MTRKIQITVAGTTVPDLKVAIGLETEEQENGPLTLLAVNFYKDLTSFLQRKGNRPGGGAGEDFTILFEDDVEEDEEEYDWEFDEADDEAEEVEEELEQELKFK